MADPIEPYLGEIRLFAGTVLPTNWVFCQGQIMSIQQNTALFSLLGTAYGGDGVSTFGLPDLRGRLPLCTDDDDYPVGQQGGEEEVILSEANLPTHTHSVTAGTKGGQDQPKNNIWAGATENVYAAGPGTIAMSALNTTISGLSEPHDNMVPFLCINYILSLTGIYPSRGEETPDEETPDGEK